MKKIYLYLVSMAIIFTFVACSAKPTEVNPGISSTTLPHPFTSVTSSNETAGVVIPEGSKRFGWKFAPLAGFESCNQPSECLINYEGRPIELSYEIETLGNNDIEIGFAIFIDGMIQPHQVIRSTQVGGELIPFDLNQYVSAHKVRMNEKIEITIRFSPITGKKGQTLSFTQMVMPYPSFLPDSPDQHFGNIQDAHPNDFGTIRFLEDAPSQLTSPVVQVESQPISESMKIVSESNPSGRVQRPFYYFNDSSADYINRLMLKDGKANLRIQMGGGVEAEYRVIIFINHKPVMIEGNESFIIKSAYDQIVTYNFILDTHELPRFNSLYATILPTGDGFLLNPESGFKSKSILLINEDAPWLGEASQTSTPGNNTMDPGMLFDSSFSQDGLQDLSSELISNNISSGDILCLTNMGGSNIFLALDEKLLLIDTSSGKIHKESPSKFDFSQRSVECFRVVDGIAILTTDALNNTTLAHFFDSDLQEIKTFDPASLLGIEDFFSNTCVISASGKLIACLDNSFTSIVVADIDSGTRLKTIDISDEFKDIRFRIQKLAFGGDDKFLAFVGIDADQSSSFKTSYGIIDLDQNRVVFTNSKTNLNELLIQVSSSQMLFVEKRHFFNSSDGSVLLFDLAKQDERLIGFTHDATEDYRESFTIRISPKGQYLTGCQVQALPRSDGFISFILRIYDMNTMAIRKEISLNGSFSGFPNVTYTSMEDSIFIALSEWSNDRQIRLLKYTIP